MSFQILVYLGVRIGRKAPSDEGAVMLNGMTGGEKIEMFKQHLSLRPFGAPPSSEGGFCPT
jgi:hypothetical protein